MAGTADLFERFGLSRLINAAGTFTPLGVSRSTQPVAEATAAALQEFFVIDELLDRASAVASAWCVAPAATVTHCTASAITLGSAAFMVRGDQSRIARLPRTDGIENRIVIPGGHDVNYGHELTQAVRLSGAEPVIAGEDTRLTRTLEQGAAGLLLVSSRLVRSAVDLREAVAAARALDIPVMIDGAAQDMRVDELLATGTDLVLVSAQKYLASPTAGLIVGSDFWVQAVRAQFTGIGRCMKPSKEAILGVLAAIEERQELDFDRWSKHQAEKTERLIQAAEKIAGVQAVAVRDPAGLPFERARLTFQSAERAGEIAMAMKNGNPKIFAMEHELAAGALSFELVPLSANEIDLIAERLAGLCR